MASQLERRIAQFTDWRTKLVTATDEFRAWQDTYGHADIEQTLRIYDLVEGLRNDRIRLAFLGESAEDKIGLINALLFSDLPGGLLPIGAGCEFLCPTEIFHDPAEAPFVRVLPIDTRKRQESIASLRRSPIEWITMRLNADSPESIADTMRSLSEPLTVGIDEAKSLNLTNVERSGDAVSIPAWRYALINLPHPMLKSGVIVFYTPALQMLSAEPEIALRMAANAQSLLIVLGKELTPTVQNVWKQYAQNSRAIKFVVLDTGAGADAAAAERVTQAFDIPASNVFQIPIKQAVVERLAHNEPSELTAGIEQLEILHAERLVPERQALLLSSVAKEIGPLVQSARQAVAARFIATIKEMQDLTSTSGKSRSVALDMLTRLETQRKTYQRSVAAFNVTYANLMARGQELLAALHDDRIEEILSHDREFISGAWTTSGMWKNMQGLFGYFGEQVEKILNYATKLKETVEGIYQNFHENFGLAKLSPPALTLAKHLEAMHDLQENASRFCHDPLNIATYRDFMVKKFYNGLVEEARQQFELTRLDTEHWLRGALGPLNVQIMERQNLMLKRVESLRNLKNNLTTVQERLKQFDQQRISLKKQGDQLDRLRADLALTTPNRLAPAASPEVTPVSS
jgi:hypothetical protein